MRPQGTRPHGGSSGALLPRQPKNVTSMINSKASTAPVVAAFLLSVLLPSTGLGLGSRIPNQDPEAIARGNAFVATADNPAALYYNPAGITQMEGHNLQLGSLFYLNIYSDYKSPTGVEVDNNHTVIPVPHFHYSFAPTNLPVAFGLGAYSPFGLGMEWPSDAPFRTSGLEAQLIYMTLSPVVAWKPFDSLSIAVGPTFNYSKAKLRQGIGAPPSPAEFEFDGSNWAYGFTVGLLFQPHPKWSFGAKYFSATSMAYEGDGTFSPSPPLPSQLETTTHLDFPQIIVAGVSFRPTTNWNFEFNVDWADWHTTDVAAIDGVGTLPLYWNSSFFYEVGATRQLGKGYYVSAGYFFSEASTPEAYYTPLVPDTDLHVGSLGVGYRGNRWRWAVAGQIIGGPYRDIDNQVVDPTVNGSYRLFTPTISVSVGYHF